MRNLENAEVGFERTAGSTSTHTHTTKPKSHQKFVFFASLYGAPYTDFAGMCVSAYLPPDLL
jgi:hypothetical protein